MRYTRVLIVFSFVSSLLIGKTAAAQPTDVSGFALDRFEPSERGSEWFALDSLDLRGKARPAIGIVADYAYKPLVFYDGDGKEVGALVEHQLFLHAGASIVAWERVRFAFNLPFSPFVKGDDGIAGVERYTVDEGVALGDIRLSADLRLFGRHRGPITGALGVAVWLPTGKREAFSGDEKVRVSPRLAIAGDIALFTYAARVDFRYRGRDGLFSGEEIGSELGFGVSAGLRVADGALVIGPEVYGTTVVQGGAFRERGTPFEGLFGLHYTIARQVRLGAGAGPGFTRGFGSPEVRAVASIEWTPGIEEDRDGDNILDKDDACPDVPGEPNKDPKKHGCPKSDRDGDKILDEVDACPDVKGVATDDPKTNGCPDTDGDGILDPLDACPTVAGPPNEDPSKNGCPPARIEAGQIRILEQIKFRIDSAEILPESDGIMQAVLQIMKDHPEITKVSVEGHTDSTGGEKYNQGLSERRVMSVLSWLTRNGIEPIRLTSVGYGLTRPIASNDSEEGRRQNRRVEFHIKEMNGKPYTPEQE